MAIVIQLPTSAPTPVINPTRRGRFPRGIVSIHKARMLRGTRALLRAEIQKQAEHLQTIRSLMGYTHEEYAIAQVELANLHRTLERAQ